MTPAVVVIGPAGSGKTTIGRGVARKLGWDFIDGDDFHPEANIAKMASGQALDDADRGPWLDRLADALRNAGRAEKPVVLACSALRQSYRDILKVHPAVRFVLLDAPAPLLQERVQRRKGHFMPASLLESQLRTLERPSGVPVIDASRPTDEVVDAVVAAIR